MSTIRETITPLVPAGYETYVNRVVNALDRRETAIKTGLSTYARRKGLSVAEVNELFIEVGLTERPAAPATPAPNITEAATQVATGIEGILNSLRQEVAALRTAAARHGIRV